MTLNEFIKKTEEEFDRNFIADFRESGDEDMAELFSAARDEMTSKLRELAEVCRGETDIEEISYVVRGGNDDDIRDTKSVNEVLGIVKRLVNELWTKFLE